MRSCITFSIFFRRPLTLVNNQYFSESAEPFIYEIMTIFEKTQYLFDIFQKTAYLCVRAVDGAGNVGPPGNIAPVFFSEAQDRYLGREK